mmetsp:Transcript_28760/g.51169  ORF Transcript_28760/g.51169 Transcript_28760/m.51169 type:complete len:419 (-) Transcript_28760:1099-2355(-)
MKKYRKPQSKRIGTKLRTNIEKKVKEHNRKMKKAAKKLQQAGLIKKSKKDPGIPNICPYKKELLEELMRKKETEQRIRQVKQLQAKEQNQKQEMEQLLASANSRAVTFDEMEFEDPQTLGFDSTRKAFYKELVKVIEASDIILEVLDARDPEGTRSEELERKVLSYGNKRLILVLNKIDLVKPDVLQAWEAQLSQSFPVVLFRANTQQQQTHLSNVAFYKKSANTDLAAQLLHSSKGLGIDSLMQLVKNYMRGGIAVTIGVVGYPNVGKSSVINSLKGSKAVGVSSTPGFTRTLQEVEIESKIKILDCPGIVFARSEDSRNDPQMILRNVIKIDNLQDPFTPVTGILEKVDPVQLMTQYAIPEFTDLQSFLANVARRRGKLRRGGTPDLESAAKIVLYDWVTGKIPYCTLPPNYMQTD